MARPRLFARRQVWLPTPWGGLVLLLLAAAAAAAGTRLAYGFLARAAPRGGGLLVVEGWVPDGAVTRALRLAEGPAYRRVYTTGGPIDPGEALAAFGDYARLTEARLVRAGLPAARVTAVPAPAARRDRTYSAALALRARLDADGVGGGNVDLVTLEPHARRSLLLYRRALGPRFRVGVVPLPHPRFDRRDWWRTSEGFKTVVMELLAYPYARWSAR